MSPAWIRKVFESDANRKADARIAEHLDWLERYAGEIHQQVLALRRELPVYAKASLADKAKLNALIKERLERIKRELSLGLSIYPQFKDYVKIFLARK